MLSIGVVKGSAAAATYFEKDNYYTRDTEGPSAWHGRGAEMLGLSGAVERTTFERLLEGRIDATTRLGVQRNSTWQHSPGLDFTFSAPKSVSLMAEDGGDRRLVQAHDLAVRKVLDWMEREGAVTRVVRDGQVERVRTGNLVLATFRHDLSRAQEPQLHTHAVIMNMTRDASGQWRSLDGRALFALAREREAGERYQQELAFQVARLGYDIAGRPDGTFEIANVPRELIEAFSTRAREVEARLERLGLDRETATGRQRADATLRTRTAKREVDRNANQQERALRIRQHGVDLGRLIETALERAAEPGRAHEPAEIARAAELAIRQAAAKLEERDAAFADKALEREARVMAFGEVDAEELRAGIDRLAQQGFLVPREVSVYSRDTRRFEPAPGWTTRDSIDQEQAMLAAAAQGRGAVTALLEPAEASRVVRQAQRASAEHGHRWTDGQARAAEGLLLSPDRMTLVQGYAGTAKTTTVLATVAHVARGLGYEVKGLAPTASAAEELAAAIGAEPRTVQRHAAELRHEHRHDAAPQRRELWIVDEASLTGARTMRQLLEAAERQDARLILVGDVKQLGSVEAGRAFGQLQEAGQRTFVLDEIVRQTNPRTREAVEASLQADAATALARLEAGGGRVIEIGTERGRDPAEARRRALEQRHAALAHAYAELSPEERQRTLVIDPSRRGRDALNARIRDELKSRGELTGPSLLAEILVPKGLTKAESTLAMSYSRGDVVRFTRDYRPKDQPSIGRNDYLTVAGVEAHRGKVQLQKADGSFVVWQPQRWGGERVESYIRGERELAKGDVITWTRNDPSLGAINSRSERIIDVDPLRGTITLERGRRAERVEIDLRQPHARHWDYGYVRTAFAGQGRTADRVLVHAESWRANLINQKSFYVAISRAREDATIVTDDRSQLIAAIAERSGEKQAALDERALQATGRAAEQAARELRHERDRRVYRQRRDQVVQRAAGEPARAVPGSERAPERQPARGRDQGLEL